MMKKLTINAAFILAVCLNANAQILVVASNEEHHAALVNPANGQIFAKLPTGKGPHEIAVSPNGELAYVANSGPQGERGNTITVLDLKSRVVKTTFDLGSYIQPHDLRASRDGSLLWVACAPAQKILEIDARSGKILKVWETEQEGGWMLAPTPDDRKIYVANLEGGSISIIDRIAGTVRTLSFRQGAIGIDCSPDGREVWVSCMNENVIAVVDNASGQITATFDSQGKAPVRVKFTPDGKRALIVHGDSNELSVFDAAKRQLLTAIKLAESPKVITLSRDGRRAFLTNPSAHKITAVDLTANKALNTFPVGKTPDGIAWSDH
jgi:DNA-binding beta-propeller fold protein YncE